MNSIEKCLESIKKFKTIKLKIDDAVLIVAMITLYAPNMNLIEKCIELKLFNRSNN